MTDEERAAVELLKDIASDDTEAHERIRSAFAAAWDMGCECALADMPESVDLTTGDVDAVYAQNPFRSGAVVRAQ